MRIETLLNYVEPQKGFIYTHTEIDRKTGTLEAKIEARKGSLVVCPVCGRRCSVYDHQPTRRYKYIPFWGLLVVFVYAARRANCRRCGVHVERVPWAQGKSPITTALAWFLARWAKRLPWNKVSWIFGVNWCQVCEAVKQAVQWGLERRDITGVEAIGVDEVYFGNKNKYMTLVYQICGLKPRLLFVAQGHKEDALSGILKQQGEDWCAHIRHVCTDLWRAYLKSVRGILPDAMHILDRFHLVARINEAVDQIRRAEAKELSKQGITILKNLRYAFLKRPENLTQSQSENLQKVINRRDLKTIRAYHWRESFQLFWQYTSPYWAGEYLRRWCNGAAKSRLKPIQTFVKTVRQHEDLILNWFRAKKRFSSGVVEAMNRGAGLVSNLARGYRNPELLKIALFHALGDLPMDTKYTHRFS